MRTGRLHLFGFSLLGLTGLVHAQNDGDHLITNPVGQTSLATDLQVPVAPVNLTVGTAPGLGATLRVRGDQLPVNDAFGVSLCTFRTDVGSGNNQNWSMVRGTEEIGRLWHEGRRTVENYF
ncbi:MAG: hypothetical protein IPJ87_09825 [Flavobacteriales bacterium]|jgi:hypothetical protein|nr:hypothetical protein [Flavobacteriales bacterium]MBK7942151.1 hypothetical protein [Flavobacteriales bacterium]MBK8949628.1 hypothetical protein [Flavobacteriales bacterium]MBK9700692.1 hypothetical protein [Flavobacteriales bacterium]